MLRGDMFRNFGLDDFNGRYNGNNHPYQIIDQKGKILLIILDRVEEERDLVDETRLCTIEVKRFQKEK